jgi:hypothetical protein
MSAHPRHPGLRTPSRRRALSAGVASAALTALVAAGAAGTAAAAPTTTTAVPASSGATSSAAAAAPAAGQGWIRFGHFSRDNGPVTVAIDGQIISSDAAFESVTPYQSVSAGPHVVTVTDVGAPGVTLTTTVNVTPGGADTVTALEGPQGLELQWFPDDLSAAPAGDAKVRVIDTLSSQPTLDAELTGGAAYGGASPYIDVPAGSYQVKVAGPGGKGVITGKNWPVAAGTVASIVVLATAHAATLEVLSDAAGVTASPSGAPQTGFGGEARALAARPVARTVASDTSLAPVGGTSVTGLARPTGRKGSTVSLADAPTAPEAVTPPDTLTIPSIGVSSSVEELGRNADGTAQVPATTTDVGWYDDGPAPGQTGPAVIVGHVDSYQGPGVFFRLGEVQPGAIIQVGEGSRTLSFQVEQVSTYDKTAFPSAAVYGAVPDRALRLITCGGPFDHATGHYLDNVVVYATEVGPA